MAHTMSSQPLEPSTMLNNHVKATANLASKLSRVQVSRCSLPDSLTIDDIYSGSSRTRIDTIPPDLQLPLLFTNHNTLYLTHRFAHKATTQSEYDMVRALWYWGISTHHSFSMANENIRYNIILMLLLLARSDLQVFCRP